MKHNVRIPDGGTKKQGDFFFFENLTFQTFKMPEGGLVAFVSGFAIFFFLAFVKNNPTVITMIVLRTAELHHVFPQAPDVRSSTPFLTFLNLS